MRLSAQPRISLRAPESGKFRGKARNFRRALRDAEGIAAHVVPGEGEWWDHHHWHADWLGRGNASWKIRREWFRALLVYFRRIAEVREQFTTPFQAWIFLSGRDAGEDATYLHTPNANGTRFPIPRCEDHTEEWGDRLYELDLARLAPEFEWRVGYIPSHDVYAEPPGIRTSALIYARGVGVSLEGTGDAHSPDAP